MDRPFLLLDVDGVLNPLSVAKPSGFTRYKLLGYEVWLSTQHGEWLRTLAQWFDLVWATTWEYQAPRLIAPRVGLPKMPVIEVDRGAVDDTWKLRDVQRFVADRPLAWVDDDLWADAFAWAEAREQPTLLIRPSATLGLTKEHVWRLEAFGRLVCDDE